MNSVCPVLKGSSSFQELVLVENTRLSEQYFSAVQKFVVFDLGLTLLPVSGQTEASQLIAQIVSSEDKTTELQEIPSSKGLSWPIKSMQPHIPGRLNVWRQKIKWILTPLINLLCQ